MLIIDIEPPDGGVRRVGVIGSCRVITPVLKAIKAGYARRVWHAYKSYTHSAFEAEQMLKVCRGRVEIPEPLSKFVFDMPQAPVFRSKWSDLVEGCQTFLVEISTFDYFQFHDYTFNYLGLSNNLVRGNGPDMLAWYRKLSPYLSDRQVVAAAEKSLEDHGVAVTPLIADILRFTRQMSSGVTSFGEAMRRLVFDPSKQWIFVPMFNVSEHPAERIGARFILRKMLTDEASAVGAKVFDTTPLVEEAGRQTALDNNGTNVTHYAHDFEIVVGKAFCRYLANSEPIV